MFGFLYHLRSPNNTCHLVMDLTSRFRTRMEWN